MQKDETKSRTWLAVEFEVDTQHEDMAGWLMMEQGAIGVEARSASKTDSTSAVLIHATFEPVVLNAQKMDVLRSQLEEYGLSYSLASLKTKEIHEEDWLAKWKEGFEPFQVGEKFVIAPPWFRDRIDANLIAGRHVIWIEPGLAFGTGVHPTTRYCLKALETKMVGQDIVDVGTGSGILAIGAALINSSINIDAVDNDPVAIKVSKENVVLNGVADRIRLLEGSTEILDNQAYDCILSNLTCEDILALLLDYLRLLRPDGVIICAGILKEKLPLLKNALETYPLAVIDEEIEGNWAGVTLGRVPVVIR